MNDDVYDTAPMNASAEGFDQTGNGTVEETGGVVNDVAEEAATALGTMAGAMVGVMAAPITAAASLAQLLPAEDAEHVVPLITDTVTESATAATPEEVELAHVESTNPAT